MSESRRQLARLHRLRLLQQRRDAAMAARAKGLLVAAERGRLSQQERLAGAEQAVALAWLRGSHSEAVFAGQLQGLEAWSVRLCEARVERVRQEEEAAREVARESERRAEQAEALMKDLQQRERRDEERRDQASSDDRFAARARWVAGRRMKNS